MALAPRLELRQGQALVMTPQLQQAIKLLQLSNLELAEYVERELERNPLLESTEAEERGNSAESGVDASDTEAASSGEQAQASTDDADSPPTNDLQLSDEAAPPDSASDLDTDYENLYADQSRSDTETQSEPAPAGLNDWSSVRGGGGGEGLDFDLEATLTEDLTLTQHLEKQLELLALEPTDQLIARTLISAADDAGYMTEPVADIAERLGTTDDHVEEILADLQGFEPTGVMARGLRECLALQLADFDRLDPVMQIFLDNLDLLAKRDFDGLMKVCDADRGDIEEMIADIRRCNPKPGLVIGGAPVQTMIPDVFVRARPSGGWAIELNSDTLPRVLVNSRYYAEVRDHARSQEDKAYLSDCLNNANWLVKSLDQRARTILKVATEIVRQQDSFLMYGVEHLKPLNLKTVAEAISMHESTVSRVTSNKYVATPRGIFELKFFFTSAIASTSGGEAHSAEAVRHRIKGMIDDESPDKILSDDKIVSLLRLSGIDIARRTVAKYRESMQIPSSVQRRREKRAMSHAL